MHKVWVGLSAPDTCKHAVREARRHHNTNRVSLGDLILHCDRLWLGWVQTLSPESRQLDPTVGTPPQLPVMTSRPTTSGVGVRVRVGVGCRVRVRVRVRVGGVRGWVVRG